MVPRMGRMPPPLARRTATITPFRVVDVMEAAWAAERAGRSIVHLEVGEPDFGTPTPVVEAAAKAIADGRVRYTSSLGIPELREASSGYYAERFGVEVPARRVVVTPGASGALLLALAATVDRDQQVLLADPGYPCNRNLIRMCEASPVGIPVGAESNYQLTAGLVADRWSPATRAVLLSSPSNPTGTMVAPAGLAAIAAEAERRGGLCFVDEIYGELVYDRPPATVLATPGLDDRSPMFVALTDGGLRNGYTVRALNKRHDERRLHLAIDGLPGAELTVVGQLGADIVVPPDDVRSMKAYVRLPPGAVRTPSTDFRFVLTDAGGRSSAQYATVFRGPE